MSDVQLYLLEKEPNGQEARSIAAGTASNLESKRLKLVDLIESIGEYLNNEDASLRAKTMAYLADVLGALPPKVLSRPQTNPGDLLNDFILSRVANGAEALGNCARGLLALEKLGSFDQGRVITVVDALLTHTSPLIRLKQQRERFEVLTLFNVLFDKYRKSLLEYHENSKDFLPRLIAYFDGEKDPRNLMIVFSVLNVAMVEWDVSADAQNLFEAVFNYFPITFRPPPDDPYGITAQQLKDRLKDCITSTSVFAPYAFPALLDKLDSTSINVKRDALQAIASCAARYGPNTISSYSITLWDTVKFEIISAQEDDLAEEALAVLYEIARQLSSSPHDGPLQTYIKPLVKECNEHFEDTPTKQSSASGSIISSVAKASPEVSDFVVKAVMPHLVSLHKNTGSLPRRRGLLEILIGLIDSNVVVFGHWRKISALADTAVVSAAPLPNIRAAANGLDNFSDECVDVLSAALTNSPVSDVSFRLLALDGLRGLVMIRQLLPDDAIAKTVRTLVDIVILEKSYGEDELKASCIDSLVQIAHQKPQLLTETAFPALMVQLPDSEVGSNNKAYVLALEVFAKLTAEQQIFNTIMVRLKNKLYSALRQGASSGYVVSILQAILYGFTHGSVNLKDPALFGMYYQDITVPFLKDIVASGDATLSQSPATKDELVLDGIGRICNMIVRSQPWVSQTEICRNTYTLFQSRSIEEVAPFKADAEVSSDTMAVSIHLVAALHRNASPHTSSTSLFKALVSYASSPSISLTARAAAIRQIGLMTNKFLDASSTSSVISPLLATAGTPSLLSSTPSLTSVNIAFSILKSLVLRTDPLLPEILPNILTTLSQPSPIGHASARAFANLLSEDDLLTKPNHCLIYTLRTQRLFSLAVPLLTKSYTMTSPSQTAIRQNYLTALTGMLRHVPYSLLQPALPELTPLLLQSLTHLGGSKPGSTAGAMDPKRAPSSADTAIQAATISVFSNIIVHDPKLVSEHAGSLVSRLLDVSCLVPSTATTTTAAVFGPGASDPRVRMAALTCLAAFVGSLRRELLLPHQRTVVKVLGRGALDDPKRAVRGEAVRCRAVWMGLEGDDED